MKIKVMKRKASISVSFQVEDDKEGVDLKNVLLGSFPDGVTAHNMVGLIELLGQMGYKAESTKSTKTVNTFKVKKRDRGAVRERA